MATANSNRKQFNIRVQDLTGRRFGRLTVICISKENSRGRRRWTCQCDCGNTVDIQTSSLNNKATRSCGCLRRIPYTKTHGMTNTAEYRTWCKMKERCRTASSKDYKDYGGRGIAVCERWTKSFEAFFSDMGNRPSASHSIERIDNDGNYCPENCKWATASEQASNKRGFRKIEHCGETMTLSQWSERAGIPLATIKWRFKNGRSVEQILHTP